MRDLQKQYLDTCDRIYLNEEAQKKQTRRDKQLEQQLEKDYQLKKELEQKLGL
jgi:hypothetical protein